MRISHLSATAAVLLTMVLAGCGGAPAAPPSSPVALPPGVVASQVVPPPELAKNAEGVDPCKLLTAGQVRQLGLDPARATPAPAGLRPGCFWGATDKLLSVSVTVDLTMGLVDIYRGHASTPLARFEPLVLDGYPAVRAEQVRETNDCTIYLGLAQTQVMWVSAGASTSKRTDTCPSSKRAISAILTNLPPLR